MRTVLDSRLAAHESDEMVRPGLEDDDLDGLGGVPEGQPGHGGGDLQAR